MKDPREHFREQAQERGLNFGFYDTTKESVMRHTIGQYDTTIRPSYDVGRTACETGPIQERHTPVYEAYSRLCQAVETLSSELIGLSSRLVPVLGTDFPTEKADASQSYGVPLADSIAHEAARVEAMIAHIRQLGVRLGL